MGYPEDHANAAMHPAYEKMGDNRHCEKNRINGSVILFLREQAVTPAGLYLRKVNIRGCASCMLFLLLPFYELVSLRFQHVSVMS